MGKFFDLANQLSKATNKITVYANKITLSGTTTDGHTAAITINGILNTTDLSYLTSTTLTAANWVVANLEYYLVRGYKLSSALGVITVTPAHPWDTVNRINATIATLTGTLTGTLAATFEPDGAKAKVWVVTFAVPDAVINAPVRMKNDDSLRVIAKTSSATSITFSGWPFAVSPDVDIISTSVPYVIDRVNNEVSLGGAQAGKVFQALGSVDGEAITDEDGNQLLIPDNVFIY